jgi:uncharacterized membrane protein
MVQLFATRCSCIAILQVSLVSFAAIALFVLLLNECLLLFISLLTQSGYFWINPRKYKYTRIVRIDTTIVSLLGIALYKLKIHSAGGCDGPCSFSSLLGITLCLSVNHNDVSEDLSPSFFVVEVTAIITFTPF